MEGIKIAEKKNTFHIAYLDSEVTLSGDFDSGNLNNAVLDIEQNVKNVIMIVSDPKFRP